jgi:2-polyprenyl-3-methyl-5-hydroxy-6-metoxy-1,4-benzoquinol methylase
MSAKKLYKCLLCGHQKLNLLKKLPYPAFTSKPEFSANVEILECENCHHLQKKVTKNILSAIKATYEKNYIKRGFGTHINIVNNKVISRDLVRAEKINCMTLVEKGGKHLDIGAGSGSFISSLKQVNSKWISSAFEVSSAREKDLKKSGAINIWTEDLKKIDEKFDLITLFHVLEHRELPPEPVSAGGQTVSVRCLLEAPA